MAINDVTLTAGMRANLVSLQGTVDLLNRTQNRLSTGKKVNTALDNPVSFFAAQALNARANNISALKDSMGQAVQTIQNADSGITAITSLVDQAKALAQSALAASKNTVKVSVGSVVAGDVITIGGTAYTAVASNVTATSTQFNVADDASTTAGNLAALINSTAESGTDMQATLSGTTISLTAKLATVAVTSAANVVTVGGTFTIQTDINSKDVFSERARLAASYNSIMSQIDAVANSAGYQGTNLLANDTLNVTFESSSLAVKGFSATASDLKLSTQATTTGGADVYFGWALNSDINTDLGKIDSAYSTLKSGASQLSSNLSIVNTQLAFSTTMVNTLTSGADKLTLADMNEEGANMLALNTKNSLGTTALSLSSQAAQSVLRLFA